MSERAEQRSTWEAVAEQVEEALDRERAAITSLDLAALDRLAGEKLRLVEELRRLATPDARSALVRIGARAEANAALISDAIDAIAASLGMTSDHGTYDARARWRSRVSSARTRAL